MKIGIVGHGADKFTKLTEEQAKVEIEGIIGKYIDDVEELVIVSGHSPVGGIDIWAEGHCYHYWPWN